MANMSEVRDDKRIPLVECFGPTIQGEGALNGQVSYFIRLGGCDFRCTWCDSMHAVDPDQIKKGATYLSQDQIIDRIRRKMRHAALNTWLTLSGGNPAMWDLSKVVAALRLDEVRIAIETQGSIVQDWFESLDMITCSPKGPSSGMLDKLNHDALQELYRRYHWKLILKIVIFSKEDLDFAEDLKGRYPNIPFYLSSGTSQDPRGDPTEAVLGQYRWLAKEFLKRPQLHSAIIGKQDHVLLWGHKLGV
jgi:7-carboxy-7-deazaguanine synthase